MRLRVNLNFSMSLAGPVETVMTAAFRAAWLLKQFFLESQLQIEKTFHPQVSVIRGAAPSNLLACFGEWTLESTGLPFLMPLTL